MQRNTIKLIRKALAGKTWGDLCTPINEEKRIDEGWHHSVTQLLLEPILADGHKLQIHLGHHMGRLAIGLSFDNKWIALVYPPDLHNGFRGPPIQRYLKGICPVGLGVDKIHVVPPEERN